MFYLLIIHSIAGGIALASGAMSIGAQKGQTLHKKAGRVYFMAMTVVFVSGIIIAVHRSNRFLFLIAFLSYYSVFCGVRSLKLKRLHVGQLPGWYDWAAGIINALANLIFIGLGVYYWFENTNLPGALLSSGFGIMGLLISYANLKPFVIRPDKPKHWYTAHIGNMMGGYIATLTAFLSTMVTRFQFMNPFIAFALPSLIGVPLLIYWIKKTERQFNDSK